MITKESKKKLRTRRHLRIRHRIQGTAERPRLCISRTGKHIYAQIIDDDKGHTLVAASTVEAEVRKDVKSGGNIEAAKRIGQEIARKAKAQGIELVVFDRGGNLYHGRVAALATAARENGLQF